MKGVKLGNSDFFFTDTVWVLKHKLEAICFCDVSFQCHDS